MQMKTKDDRDCEISGLKALTGLQRVSRIISCLSSLISLFEKKKGKMKVDADILCRWGRLDRAHLPPCREK